MFPILQGLILFIFTLDNGRLCIRFGMVSMETDVEELLALVINTGKQLDEQVNNFL